MPTDNISLLGLAFTALILLTIPVMIAVSVRRLRVRQNHFRAYAKSHGFSFTARERLPIELHELPYFRGSVQMNFRRHIKNALRRHHAGIETLLFDYWFIAHTTIALPTRRTTRATVVCLRQGKSAAWRVFHHDGLDYLDFSRLDDFVSESLKQFRAPTH